MLDTLWTNQDCKNQDQHNPSYVQADHSLDVRSLRELHLEQKRKR